MREFMLLIRNQIDHQKLWTSDTHESFLRKCEEYIETLKSADNLISAHPLVREGHIVSGADRHWQITPLNKTGEVIVGYYHTRAKDLEDATSIAQRNPEFTFSTTARVEIRPMKMIEDRTHFVYPTGT